MKNSYEIFNLRKNELCELAQKQLEISSVLDGDISESSETLTGTQKVSGIIERLKNEKFSVLVMGCLYAMIAAHSKIVRVNSFSRIGLSTAATSSL